MSHIVDDLVARGADDGLIRLARAMSEDDTYQPAPRPRRMAPKRPWRLDDGKEYPVTVTRIPVRDTAPGDDAA